MAFHYERKELTPEVVLWAMYETPSVEDWQSFLADGTDWLLDLERRGCKIGVVVDPSGMGNANGSTRRAAGEWRASHLPLIANTCVCASYVAENSIMRSVLTAVFWFARPVIPVQICASRDEALAWVQARL